MSEQIQQFPMAVELLRAIERWREYHRFVGCDMYRHAVCAIRDEAIALLGREPTAEKPIRLMLVADAKIEVLTVRTDTFSVSEAVTIQPVDGLLLTEPPGNGKHFS